METASWLFSEITAIFGAALWSFIGKGAFFGFLGFLLGLVLVASANRKGWFSRPNTAWTFLAKLNWIYIPILLSILLGVFGAVYGIQQTTNRWLSASASSIDQYVAGYLPQINRIGRQLTQHTEQSEDALYQNIMEGAGLPDNPFSKKFYYWFNRAIISFTLDKLDYPDDVAGLTRLVQERDVTQLNAGFFNGVANSLQANLVGSYFLAIYSSIFFLFLPFVLVPFAEYILFFLNKKAFVKKTAPVPEPERI